MVSASVKDVAALAGVSVGTVSNVLNRPEKVSTEVTARVQAAIDKLGFVRNDAARQLRAGLSHSVGLVVLDAAHDATLYADASRWQKALEKIEADWMEPLLHDLKAGVLDRVTLITDDGKGFTIGSGQARRWWRWPRVRRSIRCWHCADPTRPAPHSRVPRLRWPRCPLRRSHLILPLPRRQASKFAWSGWMHPRVAIMPGRWFRSRSI